MRSNQSQISEDLAYYTLIFLYMIQGITLSFFVGTLPVFLVEKGVLLSEIAVLYMLSIPFSLKLLFAPFLDVYYSNSFGKRKSYIVPVNYILSLILIGLSFEINAIIDSKNVKLLTFFGVLCIFLLALQDIAADGLGADVFKAEKSIYASLPQSIGIGLGSFLSSFVLIKLNSKTFCNYYLFSSERNEGILKISHYICFVGVLLFLMNIVIHTTLKEERKNDEEEEKSKKITLKEKIFSMKIFFTDKRLLCFICFLFLNKFTFSFVDAGFKLRLVQKGFPKEQLSNIFSILLLCGLIFQSFIPKLLKKTSEIKLFYWFFLIKLVENLMTFTILENYHIEHNNSNIFFLFLISTSLINQIQYNVAYTILGSLYNKISRTFEKGFEGTSIAFLTSIGNLGKKSTDIFALSIMDKHNLITLALSGWVFGGTLLILLRKKILELEKNVNLGIGKNKEN